jgi:two-component system cell cycle sensor histidine kinase/response regulator CckA
MDDAIVRCGIQQAEAAWIEKPFTPASLAAKVREVLDRRDSRLKRPCGDGE